MKVQVLLKNDLELDDDIVIERAHRVGGRGNPTRKDQER